MVAILGSIGASAQQSTTLKVVTFGGTLGTGFIKGVAGFEAANNVKLQVIEATGAQALTTWYGLCAPAGTPTPALDRVHTDLTAVLHVPEIEQRFKELVIEIAPTSREEFAQFIPAEAARWARVIKDAGIAQQ